ncbi:hypothetical protein [Idiomarina abyssalis]|uniref:hypothetical protein n=1 Tax=Idiomarina abyssalis TaxID=86102 RepID=UPI003A918BDE
MNGLERAGENVAIMKTLGTNPEDTYRRVMDSIKRKYEGDVKKLDSLNGRGLENRFKEVMGETRIPANHMAAKVGSIVRAVQSMSKLGGAVISAFSDVPLYAGEMRYQGRGYLSSTAEAMTGLLRGRGSQEQKEIVSVWGVTMDAVRSDLATRFSAHDDMPGAMTRAMRKFFKLNGLEWWTDTMRTSATLGMAHHIALQKSKGWDSIDDSLRHTLSLYGIDSGKWDMIRKTANKQADGRDYATPEGLRNISAVDVRSYLGKPNASESEISRLRDEVENQFRTYMQDRVEYAVINPDANTRAAMLQGTQPGTILGEGLRFVMQFKAFPVAVLQKTWGRDLFSKGQADIPALATMIAMSGLTGYVAMSAKDILKGKEPRDPLDPKTIVAAMLQGGGAGIYGDFLFGRYTRFGNSTIASLAGPTAGSFEDAVNMVQAVREGDLKGAGNEAYRFTTSHLPGANLFYTKPVMDYLITYQIQEFMNPGYLRRMEKRIAKDTGQDFWELPFASGRPSDHVPRGGLWGF